VDGVARDHNEFAQDLFRGLPRRYDALEALLSLGQNARWRAEMISHVEGSRPDSILDVATGTAGVALDLLARTPAQVTGLDLTHPMLRQGQERIEQRGAADRIHLVVGQAERLPFPDATFDALTFTYLLRYVADPAATLRELARVVKPGGWIASLEFAVPGNPFWRAWWWGYTRLVLPIAGYLAGGREWYAVGRFLGPNIDAHYRRYPVSWTVNAWRAAGLDGVQARPMSLGGGLVMWARKVDG
jgi:demethylmenaquinone methyltransferase/2-methoxy-6-polyprenyl-1,4-benzoquinol methylase